MTDSLLIDLSRGKNALFIRQTVAAAFGIPLGREFTWDDLRGLICCPGNPRIPARMEVDGFVGFSLRAAEEAEMFMAFLAELRTIRPDIEIRIRIL
jgi:hypothetical protein